MGCWGWAGLRPPQRPDVHHLLPIWTCLHGKGLGLPISFHGLCQLPDQGDNRHPSHSARPDRASVPAQQRLGWCSRMKRQLALLVKQRVC